jgi:hypothetical protein
MHVNGHGEVVFVAAPLRATSAGAATGGGMERGPAAGQQLESVILSPNEVGSCPAAGVGTTRENLHRQTDAFFQYFWQLPSPPPGKPPQYGRTPLSEINTASEQDLKNVVAREFHLSDPRFLMRVTAFV